MDRLKRGQDASRPRSESQTPRTTYVTFTSTAFGLAFSPLGRCTFSTPSLNSALTFEPSAPSGSVKLRRKFPYERSIRWYFFDQPFFLVLDDVHGRRPFRD